MELIKEIYLENDVECNKYKIRKAARSVALNSSSKIPLLYVSKNEYHKLPGGGIEENEDIEAALKREMLEEVGANIEILKEIGVIIEYKNSSETLQISYCYYSKIVGELCNTDFTEKEKNDGFVLKWVTIDEAIELITNDKPLDYMGGFIRKRDLEFLNYFKKFIFKD